MNKLKGKTVLVEWTLDKDHSFEVPVVVAEEKRAYGKDRILVTPVGGNGAHWINADKVVPHA